MKTILRITLIVLLGVLTSSCSRQIDEKHTITVAELARAQGTLPFIIRIPETVNDSFSFYIQIINSYGEPIQNHEHGYINKKEETIKVLVSQDDEGNYLCNILNHTTVKLKTNGLPHGMYLSGAETPVLDFDQIFVTFNGGDPFATLESKPGGLPNGNHLALRLSLETLLPRKK